MKISINGGAEYTRISNLSFSPEVDIAGASIPINEFSADIYTENNISVGGYATLKGRSGISFAKYWIVAAERTSENVVHVLCQSYLTLLDRKTLSPIFYNEEKASDAIEDIFTEIGIGAGTGWAIDSELAEVELKGFCPEQTARERLLWICFTIGGYVKDFGNSQNEDIIKIIPIPETETIIPVESTYWRPKVIYRDHVTAIVATDFSFSTRTAQSGEETVTDGETTWVVTRHKTRISNPNIPQTAPENIIKIDNVMLVNNGNVDEILSRLSKYYFPAMDIELEAINNGEFWPGNKIRGYLSCSGNMFVGYANKMNFSFGLQSKSKINLTACSNAESARLRINYLYQNARIGKRTYYFPVGYIYSIQNPCLDLTVEKIRTVYRPVNENATGTITQGGVADNQNMYKALILNKDTKVLKILSVDSITIESRTSGEDTIYVGVIE